jgi:hypothetical protein
MSSNSHVDHVNGCGRSMLASILNGNGQCCRSPFYTKKVTWAATRAHINAGLPTVTRIMWGLTPQ